MDYPIGSPSRRAADASPVAMNARGFSRRARGGHGDAPALCPRPYPGPKELARVASLMGATLALAFAIACAPSTASAQRLGALRASGGSGTEVVSEAVDVRCSDGEVAEQLECEVVATWQLRNPSDHALAPQVMVSLEGVGESVMVLEGVELSGSAPTLRPLSVGIPPGATITLVMRASLRVGASGSADPASSLLAGRDALSARHPVLVGPWNGTERGFRWTRPIGIRWASVGETSITVHAPAGWRVRADDFREEQQADGTYEGTFQPGGTPPPAVEVVLTHGGSRDDVRAGGPFVGLGGTFDQGFRLRAGWEMGITEWVILSASADTDFQNFVVITPMVEAATWSLIVAPSLSAGIGVPIRYGPMPSQVDTTMLVFDWTAGLRLEASATFLSVAFVASFDIYPQYGGFEITLMGRVGI